MTPQPDLSKWLSKFDAARLLGIGESTLDRRIKRTGCPEVRMRPRGNGLKPEPVCNPEDVARMAQEWKRAVTIPSVSSVAPLLPRIDHLGPSIIESLVGGFGFAVKSVADAAEAKQQRPLWLSLKQASAYTGLSMALLQRLASSGVGVVAVKDNGWKFQRGSLDELGEGLVGFLEAEK